MVNMAMKSTQKSLLTIFYCDLNILAMSSKGYECLMIDITFGK